MWGHTRPKKNALSTGGHRWVMQHNSLVMYDGRCTMYDVKFSALRAFLRSESKMKFSRMGMRWQKESVRSYAMPNLPLCWIVNGLWLFRLTSFIQGKRQGKRIWEKLINRKNALIDWYHSWYASKLWQSAIIMMTDLENSPAHVDDLKNLRNAHIINKS